MKILDEMKKKSPSDYTLAENVIVAFTMVSVAFFIIFAIVCFAWTFAIGHIWPLLIMLVSICIGTFCLSVLIYLES